MSPELLSRFEPVARAQLKQVVTNRISQFFAVDSEKVEGKDPLVVRFLGETDNLCRPDRDRNGSLTSIESGSNMSRELNKTHTV